MLLALAASALADCVTWPAEGIPADGAVGVPLDTRIVWKTSSSAEEDGVTLTGPDGAAVSASVTWRETAGAEVVAEIVPDAPLAPESTYTLADPWDTYTFTTGTTTGAAAPATPTVTAAAEADFAGDLTCSGTTSWQEDREHVDIDLVASQPVEGYVEARVRVDGGPESTVIGGGTGVALRWGGCATSNLPDMEGAERVTVAVRAVSYTGEASAWGAETTIEVPWPTIDCPEARGCATGAGMAWTGVSGAALALLARRRRGPSSPG